MPQRLPNGRRAAHGIRDDYMQESAFSENEACKVSFRYWEKHTFVPRDYTETDSEDECPGAPKKKKKRPN